MVSAALGASVAPFYKIAINLNVIIGFLISFGHALVTFFVSGGVPPRPH